LPNGIGACKRWCQGLEVVAKSPGCRLMHWMRILFVTTNKHLPELRGGMEVNTHQLSLALIERGHAVGVLCGLAGVGIAGNAARLRSKLLRDPCPVDRFLGYPTWRSYDSIPHMGRVVECFRPDTLVIQGGAEFDRMLLACLATGLPTVCYLHTQDRLPLAQHVLEHPNVSFIANSTFTRSMHPEKRFLGVVLPIVPREDYTTSTNRSVAVFINPVRYKGLDIVLALAEGRHDVSFLFVINRGYSNQDQQAQTSWRHLRNVIVEGPINDMRRVYRRAKLVVAPSQWLETWGRVATEAHFSGIPVLASNSGGLPEAVGPGGICLPTDAPASDWLNTFSKMWDDAELYKQLSQAAAAYSRRQAIDRDEIADSFLALLHSCEANRKREDSSQVATEV
jgi:glycosyltransferase involved in cell wall biosynthesis